MQKKHFSAEAGKKYKARAAPLLARPCVQCADSAGWVPGWCWFLHTRPVPKGSSVDLHSSPGSSMGIHLMRTIYSNRKSQVRGPGDLNPSLAQELCPETLPACASLRLFFSAEEWLGNSVCFVAGAEPSNRTTGKHLGGIHLSFYICRVLVPALPGVYQNLQMLKDLF